MLVRDGTSSPNSLHQNSTVWRNSLKRSSSINSHVEARSIGISPWQCHIKTISRKPYRSVLGGAIAVIFAFMVDSFAVTTIFITLQAFCQLQPYGVRPRTPLVLDKPTLCTILAVCTFPATRTCRRPFQLETVRILSLSVWTGQLVEGWVSIACYRLRLEASYLYFPPHSFGYPLITVVHLPPSTEFVTLITFVRNSFDERRPRFHHRQFEHICARSSHTLNGTDHICNVLWR